jgi:hypothetical protein
MKRLKKDDMVIFTKNYKDSVQKGEARPIDKAVYIDDKLSGVYIKLDHTWIYLNGNDFEEYCKPYEITKVVSVSMSTQEEMKRMYDIECKLIDEIIKKAEKQIEKEVKEYDYINPAHYRINGKETFDMMVLIWGVDNAIAHCEMTAFKYRMRAGKKPDQPIERDMEKAKWYEDKAKELRNGKK